MPIETRLLYSSANGDRWFLCHDPDTAHVFVRHEPAATSGGQASEMEIAIFLTRGSLHPEQEALLNLIGTLVPGE